MKEKTKKQLIAELEEKGVSAHGNKKELIKIATRNHVPVLYKIEEIQEAGMINLRECCRYYLNVAESTLKLAIH